ncbi:DUF6932 family protein [Streptomyces sp. NPDC003007]
MSRGQRTRRHTPHPHGVHPYPTGLHVLPSFAANGFLPLGRYSVSFDEAEAMLVSTPEFQDSATRQTLWDGLHSYLDWIASSRWRMRTRTSWTGTRSSTGCGSAAAS